MATGKRKFEERRSTVREWLRAELVRHTRKIVVVVSGSARGKPSWKKGPVMERKQPTTNVPTNNGVHGSVLSKGCVKGNLQSEATFMEVEPSGVLASYHDILHRNVSSNIGEMSEGLNKSMESLVGQGQPTYTLPMQKLVCNKGGVGHSEGLNDIFSFGASQTPLADITNTVAMQPLKSTKKKWTKLLREVGETDSSSDMETSESRRPELETVDLTVRKKKRDSLVVKVGKENNQVVAGSQHHQSQ